MKPIAIAAIIFGVALPAVADEKKANELIQAAQAKETVQGDLKAAIQLYGQAVKESGANRGLAAKTLLRMAECYQKMGDAEARKIYEQVVREYADQKEAVTLARARLGSEPGEGGSRTAFRQVWTLPQGGDLFGTVSRDGRYLPYVGWAQNGDLFLHDFSSGSDRRLTNTATDGIRGAVSQYAEETSFSRDGGKLAYSWFRGDRGRYELRLVDVRSDGIPQPRFLFDNEDISWISPDDWSPDGKWIAVQIQRRDKTGQLGLVSTADGSLRVLKSSDWRGSSRLVFSPDGKYIAFDLPASDTTDQRDVYLLAADGSREVPAVVGPSQDTVVGWSNDGRRLLFASDRGGSVGLWSVAFADGKIEGPAELLKRDIGQIECLGFTDAGKLYAAVENLGRGDIQVAAIDFTTGKLLSPPSTAVPTYVGSNSTPDWSADGKYLAYASRRGTMGPRHFVVGIRSTETGEVRELSPSPGFDLLNSLVWAPDGGSLIVRGRDNKGRAGIFRVDAQTGRSSILVTKGEREGLSPAVSISADGTKLYYAHALQNGYVWMMKDLPSGNEKELLRNPELGVGTVSPDGRYLAIGSMAQSKPRTLFILPTTGGELRELTHETELRQIRGLGWAADGSAIYILKAGEFWRLPVDGSEPKKVGAPWTGGNFQTGPFKVHPDGRRIVFQAMTVKKPTEVWVLENFLPLPNAGK